MSEQERSKETPIEFPRVPIGIMAEVVEQLKTIFTLELEDPQLEWIASEMSKYAQNPEEFMVGLKLTKIIFDRLEDVGFRFPKISQETMETLLVEAKAANEELRKISEMSHVSSTKVDKQGKRFVEFNFPTPRTYIKENPALMLWINNMPTYGQMGAITFYELKRRQFHADQLTAQFGNK